MTISGTDERLIERYAIRRGDLPEEDRARVQDLLGASEEARALLAAFTRFYGELRVEEAPGAVDRFVDRMTAPFDDRPAPVHLGPIPRFVSPGPTVLAAKSATSARPRFEPVAVLGDARQSVIFRLLRDNDSGETLIFQIGEAAGPSVLELPSLGIDFVIGSDGRGRTRQAMRRVDWDAVTAVWHPAQARVMLDGPGSGVDGDLRVDVRVTDEGYSLEARGVSRSLLLEHAGGIFAVGADDGQVPGRLVSIAFPVLAASCP